LLGNTKVVNMEKNRYIWLEYIVVAIIVIAFFVICRCGYFFSDDYAMAYGSYSSFMDVVNQTWRWYHQSGGRLFSVGAQYFISGLVGSKLLFDVVNTLFFVLLILICGKLISGNKGKTIHYSLLFALLFWFLCPVPRETMFWLAGATTHMWGNTLAYAFLLIYMQHKEANYKLGGKVLLFFLSVVSVAEFIPCVSIFGAIVVYYLFHLKEFKRNAVPLVLGFAVGAVILLLAPGNFGRAEAIGEFYSFGDKVKAVLFHPFFEMFKYKAVWLFCVTWFIGWLVDKKAAKDWAKNNSFLLYALGWSMVAFSIVFRPSRRALFFPETLSMILLLLFLTNEKIKLALGGFVFSRFGNLARKKRTIVRLFAALVFLVFIIDSGFACVETIKQKSNNDRLLSEIQESDGIRGVDLILSKHRMANAPIFPDWSWPGLAQKLGVDSVHVYPYYCQEKYYMNSRFGEQVYVDEDGLISAGWEEGSLGPYGIVFIRIDERKKRYEHGRIKITIDYIRPQKWYHSLLRAGRNDNAERSAEVVKEQADEIHLGYEYYIVWVKKENLKNLKSVKFEEVE